jgi:NAD(P)-dependent dehydrogenase (short-subunit alcohol dehydrogenase family)
MQPYFDTNVLGTLLGMKHEMRVMAAQGSGSIVNLSSVLGKVGARGRCERRARQCRGAGADRVRDAQSLHRRRRG